MTTPDDTTSAPDDPSGAEVVAGEPVGIGSGRRLAAVVFDLYALFPFFQAVFSWLPRGTANLVALAAWFIVQIGLETVTGATPGKLLAGLRVRTSDGGFPGLRSTLLRRAWLVLLLGGPLLISLLSNVIGDMASTVIAVIAGPAIVGSLVITINNSETGRGWHDRLGGTTVFIEFPVARPVVLIVAGLITLGVPLLIP